MKKEVFLISAVLSIIVFVVLLVETIRSGVQNNVPVSFKEIVYWVGWFLLAVSSSYHYYSQ